MDQTPAPEGFTLAQALWMAVALLGLFWGLLLGLLGWVFRLVWSRVTDLGRRVHQLEVEHASMAPMVRETWMEKRDRDKKEERDG